MLIHPVADSIVLPEGWNSLDEKTVQAAVHHRYPFLEREVKLDSCFLDFLTPGHTVIELKKSWTDKGKRYLTRPSHAVGQVLGYKSSYSYLAQLPVEKVNAVILLYGSQLGLWKEDEVTRLRNMTGVKLWVLVSLADAHIIDLDTGKEVNLLEW